MHEESPKLVGREPALAKLHGLLARAMQGQGGAALVRGEAGIGKSRVLEELAKHAHGLAGSTGLDVVWGRAWEAGGAPAYWPWVEALRGLCRRRAGLLTQLVPARRALLGQLAPEFLAAAARPYEVPAERARFLLLDALAATLCDAAHERPLLVLLEDMHVADFDSLLALELVASRTRDSGLLVVGSLRPGQAAAHSAVLTRVERLCTLVELPRLTQAEVISLAQQTLQRPLEQPHANELLRTCDGNPLFVVELSHLLSQPATARESVVSPRLLPSGVRAIIEQRIDALSPGTQALLAHAAVIGREFDTGMLASTLANPGSALGCALAEAIDAHILERTGLRSMRFRHVLLRDALYVRLSESERATRHGQLADVLAHTTDALGGPPWPELAHHLARAGESEGERAIEAAIAAAEQARGRLAFDDAAHWLSRALLQHERSARPDARRTAELCLRLARVRSALSDRAGCHALCLRAAELARRERDPELLGRAALEHGRMFVFAAVDPELVRLLDEALSVLPADRVGLRARLLARRAAALQPARDPQVPIAFAREALALARTVDEPETLLETLRAVTSTMADLGDPRERAQLNREFADLASVLGEPVEELRGLGRLTHDLSELGELAEARDVVARASALAERLDAPFARWPVLGLQSMLATYAGEFERGQALADAAHEQANMAFDPNAARALTLSQVLRSWLHGQPARSLEQMPKLREVMVELPFMSPYLELLEGTLEHLVHGAAPPARSEIVQLALGTGDPGLLSLTAWRAYLSCDRELAAQVNSRLQQRTGQLVSWGAIGLCIDMPVDALLALLQITLGQRAHAQRLLEAALALTRATGGVRHEAWIASMLAELARSNSDAAAAQAYEGHARELSTRHGFSLRYTALLEPASTIEVAPRAHAEPSHEVIAARETSARSPADPGAFSPLLLELAGELWRLRSRDATLLLEDSKGVRYLAALIASPRRPFHVLELIGHVDGVQSGDAGESLDRHAIARYRARLQTLRKELEAAEAGPRALPLREELEALEDHLRAELALGGRVRRKGSPVERARVNVQRRIRDALKRIEQQSPELGRSLARAVRTGTICSYEP
jgi:hypothetical protein